MANEIVSRADASLMNIFGLQGIAETINAYASEELKQRFFSNMSSRAVEMIRDDLETIGPVRITEVEAMQQAIVKTAMRLQEEESLSVSNSNNNVMP